MNSATNNKQYQALLTELRKHPLFPEIKDITAEQVEEFKRNFGKYCNEEMGEKRIGHVDDLELRILILRSYYARRGNGVSERFWNESSEVMRLKYETQLETFSDHAETCHQFFYNLTLARLANSIPPKYLIQYRRGGNLVLVPLNPPKIKNRISLEYPHLIIFN